MRYSHTIPNPGVQVMKIDEVEFSVILDKLDALAVAVRTLAEHRSVQDWYTTAEVAERCGKAEFTVREWCRLRRIHAEKRNSGRGPHAAWVISHQELLRLQREGLLPLP